MLDKVLALLARFRRILALGEYEIDVTLVPDLEALGQCVTDPTYQAAAIQLRDPGDGSHSDWARTLLHELVHVRMGGALGTEPGSEERAALERGVEMMTRILWRMISGGSSDSAVSRVAAGCARSLSTAREGTRRNDMNGKRIVEIAVALSAMSLPEEAMALVTELSGLAIEGDGGENIEPAAEAPKPGEEIDPAMAAMPPAYRKQISDQMGRIKADMNAAEGRSIMARAESDIGDKNFKPAWRNRLNGMRRDEDPRRTYVEGITAGRADGPKSQAPLARSAISAPVETPNPTQGAATDPIVLAGEDPTKIPAHVQLVRRQLGGAFGHATVKNVLGNGNTGGIVQ